MWIIEPKRFDFKIITSVFEYKGWSNFHSEAPYNAGAWKLRNIEVLRYSTYINKKNKQTLQIIFMVNNPTVEFYAWEMPVQDSEYSSFKLWIRDHIPAIWKNLLLEKEDGTLKDDSGN